MNALMIDKADDVAVVTRPVMQGEIISYICSGSEQKLTAQEFIPQFHKVAVRQITEGAQVHKYGFVIGVATSDICLGTHVHTHNMISPERGSKT